MKRGLIMAIALCAIVGGVFASEDDGIFTFKVGRFEVFMLVESQRDGNAEILVDVDNELLSRYIPETGFKHTVNAILIKASGKNILVDTGTGADDIIVEKIKKLGVPPEKVDSVLITHLHGDHFGSLQKDGKAVFPKAKVYLSTRERDYFTKTEVNDDAVAALAPYGRNVVTFEPGVLGTKGKTVLSGITPFASYGHTPGHTVFLVENGKDKLLIAGDFLHVALVQFAEPDISATYDMDKEAAAASRKQVLDYAAKNKIPIAGMHVVYPGVGTVEAADNGYTFTPLQ